jgi:carbamoyltransferase
MECDAQQGSFLGPRHSNADVRSFLDREGAVYTCYDSEGDLVSAIADLIAQGKVVGHLAGRMEFGPRALGNRSILGDARSASMQSTMNLKIKFRESFRPFAPAVLREDVAEYFEMRPNEDSPYMLLVAPVRKEKLSHVEEEDGEGLDKLRLRQLRSQLPAITHVDDSARVQTIDADRHPRLHAILRAFKAKTGSSVVINTSFNVRGEPIVNTPAEAYRCFMHTNMDALVLESCILLRQDQPTAREVDRESYLAEFSLD